MTTDALLGCDHRRWSPLLAPARADFIDKQASSTGNTTGGLNHEYLAQPGASGGP